MNGAELDVGLTALCENAKPQQTLTIRDIADVCGCSHGTIFKIEKVALEKLKRNPKTQQLFKELSN